MLSTPTCARFSRARHKQSLDIKVNINSHAFRVHVINTHMSFFQSGKKRIDRPGRIHGDPTIGLCNRLAIQVERILDCALSRETMENTQLFLEGIPREVASARFIEATSTTPTPTMSGLKVTRIDDRPRFARVQCTLNIPLEVQYEDETRTIRTATTRCYSNYDVVLFVPQESVFPFEITAQSSVQSSVGTIDLLGPTANATICVTTAIKVIATSDIMIPAYGFAPAPPAVTFSEDVCKGFFDLPLFPTSR